MHDELKYLVENGIIDVSSIQSMYEMNKRKELLDKHPYDYWQGKNGKWYVYLPDKEKGRVLKKRNTQKEIEDVVVGYQSELIENPTIKEVFDEWNDYRLDLKKIEKSSHTRMKQVFNRHYKTFGQKRIKDVTQEDFVEFLERQIPEHNLSSKAFASLKTITRGFLKRAKRKKLITFSPELMFADLDVSENEFAKTHKEDYEQVFDEPETSAMISYLTENIDIINSAILLLFVSGMRIGEVAALKHEDLDPFKNTVRIRRTETRYSEDGKTYYAVKNYPKTKSGMREIVIPSSYRWLIRDLFYCSENREYVFEDDNDDRIQTYKIRKREYYVCKQVGAYKKSPHKIRATYDTILLDANIDRRMVKDQMGHADIKTSESNYHRNRKSHDRKVSIMDSIPEFRMA